MANLRAAMSGEMRRAPHRWRTVIVATASLALITAGDLVVMSTAVLPPIASAATSCGSPQPFHVHYDVATGSGSATSPNLTMITAVTISTLDAGCNGKTAKLALVGNVSGTPKTTAHVMSTATSKLGPCTQAILPSPPTVTAGSITFTLCKTGGPATDVSVHDLTGITLAVAGTIVVVTPKTSPSSSNNGGTTTAGSNSGNQNVPLATAASTGSSLAFTGADIAAMTIGGLLVILLGLFLLLLSRRRRSQATDGSTP